jgi:hypothetical protein
MWEAFKFLPSFIKKTIAFIVAYSTALISGYVWLEAKIKAAEDNAVTMMKEYRKGDMDNLNRQLDDIKQDLRDVKNILMRKTGK